MRLQTTRIAQLASRGRSVAEIAVRVGVSKVDVCRILTKQAETAALQKWKEPAKLPREAPAPRVPKPARVPTPQRQSQTSDKGAYIPTREEIREKCREIRRTWSPRERVVRYYLSRVDGVTLNYSQVKEMQAVRIHKDVKLLELADMVAYTHLNLK